MTGVDTLKVVSDRVVVIVSELARKGEILTIDGEIGYLLRVCEAHKTAIENTPDGVRIYEILSTLETLRRSLLTAFCHQVHKNEKEMWIRRMDKVGGLAYTMYLNCKEAAKPDDSEDHETGRKLSPEDHARRELKEQIELAKTGGFKAQLDIIVKRMLAEENERKHTQAVSEAKEKHAGVTANEIDPHDYDTEFSKLAKHMRFTNNRLLCEETYGVTSWPVVLANYSIDKIALKSLIENGIQYDRVLGKYLQIHNCKMLGIRSEILPSKPQYYRRMAEEVFNVIASSNGVVKGLCLSSAPAKTINSHTYFILLPTVSEKSTKIAQWDFYRVPQKQA